MLQGCLRTPNLKGGLIQVTLCGNGWGGEELARCRDMWQGQRVVEEAKEGQCRQWGARSEAQPERSTRGQLRQNIKSERCFVHCWLSNGMLQSPFFLLHKGTSYGHSKWFLIRLSATHFISSFNRTPCSVCTTLYWVFKGTGLWLLGSTPHLSPVSYLRCNQFHQFK